MFYIKWRKGQIIGIIKFLLTSVICMFFYNMSNDCNLLYCEILYIVLFKTEKTENRDHYILLEISSLKLIRKIISNFNTCRKNILLCYIFQFEENK